MQIPLDPRVTKLTELPYTLSFVIRKRQQIDSLSELPKEKQVPEELIWNGTIEEINEWVDSAIGGGKKDNHIYIDDEDIE